MIRVYCVYWIDYRQIGDTVTLKTKVVLSEKITSNFRKKQKVMKFIPCLTIDLHSPERATESKSNPGQEFLKFI